MTEAGLSLGSNIGDKAAMIEAALARLDASPGIRIVRRSRLYRTQPWGKEDQDWFVNACALIETELSPRALLDRCQEIEKALGRDRTKQERGGPRSIDIDILFHGDARIMEPDLEIPHPRMLERAFVLVPLAEIAADRRINDMRIADAAAKLESSGVVPFEA